MGGSRSANIKDEFQDGGPAEGWAYAWNPNGKPGNSANFAPLLWSESAHMLQHNRRRDHGARLQKSHNDDYLQLGENWGHPGQQNYMPIAGYTIQADDGDGLYRLIDSSIQKTDGTKSRKRMVWACSST